MQETFQIKQKYLSKTKINKAFLTSSNERANTVIEDNSVFILQWDYKVWFRCSGVYIIMKQYCEVADYTLIKWEW